MKRIESRKYAEELAACFAPAMTPHGTEKLLAEMANWTPLPDRIIEFVEEVVNDKL